MRDRRRVVKIWVVLLTAVTAFATVGVVGLGAAHSRPIESNQSAPAQERGSGSDLHPAGGLSTPAVQPLLGAAAAEVWADEIISPNAQADGYFGNSVALSGTTIVVGAPYETAAGDLDAGHAYTFNAKTGALISTLTSPNAQTGGNFGTSVAVSGRTVVVGAPYETAAGDLDAGHAYTFNAKTGALISTLTSPSAQGGGNFGTSVAVSGRTVVVGAVGETVSGDFAAGQAYTFNAKTGTLISTLSSPNAQTDGYFGTSVAVSGRTVVVGALLENASGYEYAGHAYTFNAKTGALISTLTSPNPQGRGVFGTSVAVSGTTVVVGAPFETAAGDLDAGHAYTFNARTGALISTLNSPNAQTDGYFGSSVAVSGTTVVVGAYGENASGAAFAGHAYTFNAKTGTLISTLNSPNTQTDGYFGNSVAISGKSVVVGSPTEFAFGQSRAGIAYLF